MLEVDTFPVQRTIYLSAAFLKLTGSLKNKVSLGERLRTMQSERLHHGGGEIKGLFGLLTPICRTPCASKP